MTEQLVLEGVIEDISSKILSGALKAGKKVISTSFKGIPGLAFIGKKIDKGEYVRIKDVKQALSVWKKFKKVIDDVYDEDKKQVDTDVLVDKLGEAAYNSTVTLLAFGGGLPGIYAKGLWSFVTKKYWDALGESIKKDVKKLRDDAKTATEEVDSSSQGWHGVMVPSGDTPKPGTVGGVADSEGWYGEMENENSVLSEHKAVLRWQRLSGIS
jgi:hypothetical protein